MTYSRKTSRRDDYRRDRRSSSLEYRRSHRSRRSRSPYHHRYRSVSRSPEASRSGHREAVHRKRIRVDSPEPSRCLGVFGLSVYTTEPYLMDIFCPFGTVEKANVVYDAKTRLSRGFGFVYFKNQTEAAAARLNCNGLQVHGRRIRVDFSITDRPHSPTPGVYMGRCGSGSPPSREYSRSACRRYQGYSRSRSSSGCR
ncbi:transformer-2 protein homolog beta-like [Anopheles bellator]|uniref:transformer-2 protein homolog beta-like n=1 Tax=Anopheles bellator TaxID=139047 RepID=UPI0026489257|nr:transformer-2 protein homolog beta-like [Anopheles bellator]